MRLNKILVVGCLMLGFPAASFGETFNQDDLFKSKTSAHSQAAGAFERTAANISSTNKSAEARRLIEIANAKIANDPNNDKFYAARAQCYRDLAEFDSALKDVNHAIQLNSQDSKYYLLRAAVLGLQNNFAASLLDIDKAIALGHPTADLYYEKSDCLLVLKRYPESVKAADCSLLIGPSAEAYACRGMAKYYLRDYGGARADLDSAGHLDSEGSARVSELRRMLSR
jgi:tetratricopeptide (TPR) repeat protein